MYPPNEKLIKIIYFSLAFFVIGVILVIES
nr:MAG TPA: protein of unknown function (DUF872) [Caudoviricetes sp.]